MRCVTSLEIPWFGGVVRLTRTEHRSEIPPRPVVETTGVELESLRPVAKCGPVAPVVQLRKSA